MKMKFYITSLKNSKIILWSRINIAQLMSGLQPLTRVQWMILCWGHNRVMRGFSFEISAAIKIPWGCFRRNRTKWRHGFVNKTNEPNRNNKTSYDKLIYSYRSSPSNPPVSDQNTIYHILRHKSLDDLNRPSHSGISKDTLIATEDGAPWLATRSKRTSIQNDR